MIGATKRWFQRNRKGLAIGASVIGAGYLAGQYALSKLSEARERMSSDKIAREKLVLNLSLLLLPFIYLPACGWLANGPQLIACTSLRRRFEQNQTDCTYTVLALLPTASDDILQDLPVEKLTKELQKKREERLARLNSGEATGSDLSSVSPSLPEDDRRSASSEGFVHASQVGEPTGEGDGQQQQQQPRPKRNKTQLWNEVKITCMLRLDVVAGSWSRWELTQHSYHQVLYSYLHPFPFDYLYSGPTQPSWPSKLPVERYLFGKPSCRCIYNPPRGP